MKLLGRCQEGIEFTALCFPSICSPLNRAVTLRHHPEFQELELADLPPSNNCRHDDGTILTYFLALIIIGRLFTMKLFEDLVDW